MAQVNIPLHILDFFQQYPSKEEIDSWSFKILPKKSSSPSLIIVVENPDPDVECLKNIYGNQNKICMKVWFKSHQKIIDPEDTSFNIQKQIEYIQEDDNRQDSLEYEKNIYIRHIHPILERNPNAPFLKYLGDDNDCSTVNTLMKFIGATSESQKFIVKVALEQLWTSGGTYTNDYCLKESICKFYAGRKYTADSLNEIKNISKKRIGAIILPFIEFRDFAGVLKTDMGIEAFREVIKGTYQIHKKRLVHNDLHLGNILVEKNTNKPLIYDWDRSYSVELGNNPSLNANPCDDNEEDDGRCSQSQCNLFIKQRPVDIFKIMCGILHEFKKDGFEFFITNVMKIDNFVKNNRSVAEIISTGITKCSNYACFFEFQKRLLTCSSLYKENFCPELELAISELGTVSAIYHRACQEELDSKVDNEIDKDKIKNYKNEARIISSDSEEDEKGEFSFAKFRMTEVVNDVSKKHDYNVGKKGIKSNKMKGMEELNMLVNIPTNDFTWNNYFRLEYNINYMKYGPPKKPKHIKTVPIETIPVKTWQFS